MQAQLACVLFLCFTCGGLCSDVDTEQRSIEEDLLSRLLTSKLKQSRQSSPYGRVSLLNLCRGASSLRPPWQQVWSVEDGEEEEEEEQRSQQPDSLPLPLGELQRLCSVLKPRQGRLLHDSPDYLDGEHDSDKRKSPYILKRQLHTTKSRRPYILKRSPFY